MGSVFSLFSKRNTARLSTAARNYSINGITMRIVDFATSVAADAVASELASDTYRLNDIEFVPGDTVIDLGGHVGMVSIYLARKYPFLEIYAYEPSPANYRHFILNLSANEIENVQVFNRAVTKDGRVLKMIAYYQSNSGGATAHLRNMKLPERINFKTKSVTLDSIFADHKIVRCKLLKVDIEGSEHEVLLSTKSLDRVDYLVGEFHINDYLSEKGYSVAALHDHLKQFIPEQNITFTSRRMAE